MTTSLLGEDFATTTIDTSGARIHLAHNGARERPPLLLLHGYPQTHAMWHKLAPRLAPHFHVVAMDLRGYGDSAKPAGGPGHALYAKRALAQDAVEVMRALGHERFMVAGHDRGARVTHRLCLDHPQAVTRAAVLDIVPTMYAYAHTDRAFGEAYFHWFFLIQPAPLPERMLGAMAEDWVRSRLLRWGAHNEAAFDPRAVAEYLRCFCTEQAIHATCEDYRAAATIDLEHDRHDIGRRIECPLLALWGARGFVGRSYDVLAVWVEHARKVQGQALDCGHFLAEEQPDATAQALLGFFGQS